MNLDDINIFVKLVNDEELYVIDQQHIDTLKFADEIEDSVIKALQAIGCDTAKTVLELSNEEITRRTGLSDDVIDDVKQVLKSEFED